jgi:ComF family protein
MHNSLFPELIRDFVSLIFPNYCLACEASLVKGENLICTRCMLQMPQTNYHLDDNNALKNRLGGRIRLAHAMAMFKFSKNGRVQSLLHALKYRNQPALGIMLGNVYGDRIAAADLGQAFDLIVPVPLHPSRKRKRGYNQSAKFAEGLAQKLGLDFSDDLIERRIRTTTQTRKTKLKRWENVSDVFHVNDRHRFEDKNILLVDDVITTGATLEACGNHIVKSGCASLSIACIAEA